MIAILTWNLGLLVGLYVSHRWTVVPLWETEKKLRKKIKALLLRNRRGKLASESPDPPSLTPSWGAESTLLIIPEEWEGNFRDFEETDNTKIPKIPHRIHSDVLFISNPGDLLK